MSHEDMTDALRADLTAVPLMDVHTHLTGGRLGARGLHDILLYHMVVSDLYAAGVPNGRRLTEFPGWPERDEAHARLREAIPYLEKIANTSCFWGVRIILRDLYDWHEPLTDGNWERLDARVRERADDRGWQREIMRRANISRAVTELSRRDQGQDDDILHYSMEWAFFTRIQQNEFDTALCELENCWGLPPGPPRSLAPGRRTPPLRRIRTLEDVHAALTHYVQQLAAAPVISMATHLSGDIFLRPVSDEAMRAALLKREHAGQAERDVYAAYIHEAFLTALAPHADRVVFQASMAAEPLPHETGSLVPQRALAELAACVSRHPAIRFVIFLSSRHANQSLCTFCRELPNLALAGYWWHNFFPGAMRQVMEERLDMLPANKQLGFFSDAYCIEWSYAKAVMVRTQLAQVLAQKVTQGQYRRDEALRIARAILYDSAQGLLGMKAPMN
ncbi:MAG: hypothetical protein WCI17_05195 [bacterium]